MYMYVSQHLCLQLGYITNDSRVGRTSRKAVHVQELHTLHSNGRARASLGLRLGYWFGVRVDFRRVRLGFGLGCAASCVLYVRQPAAYP